MKNYFMKQRNMRVAFLVAVFILPMMIPMIAHAQTVYVTKTGSKYHVRACGRGNFYTVSLEEATNRGLEPCKKCFPNGAPSVSKEKDSSSSEKKQKKPTLNCSSKTLIVKQSAKLKVNNYKGFVKWQTSNKKIVSVSKGKVTAKRKGKATITAICGDYKKTCKVKVENPYLNYTNITMKVGENFYKLKLKGCSHDYDMNWDCNSDIIGVDDESIEAYEPGSAMVIVKVHGKKFKCAVHVIEDQQTTNENFGNAS